MPEVKYARGQLWHESLQKDSSMGFVIQKTFEEYLPRAVSCAR